MKHSILLLVFLTTLGMTTTVLSEKSHTDHNDEQVDHHAETAESDSLESHIDDELAAEVGIETQVVGPAELELSTVLFGSLISGPAQLSHVRARFEGVIKSVPVTIGDQVKTGDVLAEVESNDSLRTYQLRAPISGLVAQRHANIGEFTQDQVLFSITNLDTLWAELRLFPSQQGAVKEGQAAWIVAQGERISAKIDHLVPSLDSPYQLARIKLDNARWRLTPGQVIEAEVIINQLGVASAVSVDSIQEIEGEQGIFVKAGEEYVFTPLNLGKRDDHYVEVIDGVDVGQEYVSVNSYLIKADIKKSEAEHDH